MVKPGPEILAQDRRRRWRRSPIKGKVSGAMPSSSNPEVYVCERSVRNKEQSINDTCLGTWFKKHLNNVFCVFDEQFEVTGPDFHS